MFEKLKAWAKSLPPWAWIGALVVAGGAIYFFNKSSTASSSTGTQSDQSLSSTDVSGYPTDYQDNQASGPVVSSNPIIAPTDGTTTSTDGSTSNQPLPPTTSGTDTQNPPAGNPDNYQGHSAEYWACIASCNSRIGKHKGHPCHDECDKKYPKGGGLGAGGFFDDWSMVHSEYHNDGSLHLYSLLDEANNYTYERDVSGYGAGGLNITTPVKVMGGDGIASDGIPPYEDSGWPYGGGGQPYDEIGEGWFEG